VHHLSVYVLLIGVFPYNQATVLFKNNCIVKRHDVIAEKWLWEWCSALFKGNMRTGCLGFFFFFFTASRVKHTHTKQH